MAECSFKFNIDSNPAEIINKVKLKIEYEGGNFTLSSFSFVSMM